MTRKRANNVSLEDFGPEYHGPEFITKDHIHEVLDKMRANYGEFSTRAVHQFYEKYDIAVIEWEQRRVDGEPTPLPFGRLVIKRHTPEYKGTKVWKDYECKSEYVVDFWDEIFRQVNKYLCKVEYAQKMELQNAEQIAREEQARLQNITDLAMVITD